MKSKSFPIESIVLEPRCQVRASIHHDAVDEYTEAVASLPPIDVFLVAGAPHVVDGFHRLTAHLKAGTSFVRCAIVGEGTLEQAVWQASRANRGHGLRRSNEDKRKAVRTALESTIGAEQSSNVIAEWVGVSDKLVSEIRATIELRNSEVDPNPPKRIGKDGKARPATQPKREKPAKEDASPTSQEVRRDDVPSVPAVPAVLTTAQPMPTHGPALLAAADALRGVRLEIRRILPDEIRERHDAPLKSAETAMRLDVPVVCEACKGTGCTPCQRRGWVFRSQLGTVPRAGEARS